MWHNTSYQSEKELFNFDYKKDLRNHVVSRDRVFGTRKLAEIKNESDDEEELAIKNQLSLINETTHQKVDKQVVKPTPSTSNKKKNMQDELVNEESEEFPDEMPKGFGFGAFAKWSAWTELNDGE